MSANVVSARRRAQAAKHAQRAYTCVGGKVCRGNGGWTSHKRACPHWAERRKKQQP